MDTPSDSSVLIQLLEFFEINKVGIIGNIVLTLFVSKLKLITKQINSNAT